MPLFTQHYNLGIKLANEGYSASLDRTRFLTIDNLLAFLCDIIGDGRIDGWNISGNGSYGIRVSSGVGLIGRYATRTFGPIDLTVPNDGLWFLWMDRKPEVIGGFSDFSLPISFVQTDTTPPNLPTSLVVTSATWDTVTLDWQPSTSADISEYRIYRATDNISGWTNATPVGVVSVSAFTDTGLADDTQYYYRVRSVDSSGNESVGYAAISCMTAEDVRQPAPPRSAVVYAGDGFLQASWLLSPDSFVTGYTVTLQPLNANGNPEGQPVVGTTDASTRDYTFTALTNGTKYSVTVAASQKNGVLSEGISVVSTPTFNDGPAEVNSVSLVDTWDTQSQSVTLHLSWTPDSGQAVPDRYSITLTEAGTNSSTFAVLAGTTKLITVINGKRIKESAEYSVRVQGIDAAGNSNVGVIKTITTHKFTSPLPPSSPSVSLYDNTYMKVSWTNPDSDFAYIKVSAIRTDLITSATTTLLTNQNAGKASSFPLLSYAVELSSLYTFTLVAVDSAGNESGPVTATFEVDGDVPLPPVPEVLTADCTLGCIVVRWNAAAVGNVAGYKVYRASASSNLMPSDFSLLDTVDSQTLEMLDYDVVTGVRYAYIVTTLDTYGNESHGPGDNTPVFSIVFATMQSKPSISRPENVLGSLSGNSYTLTWDPATDFFDGWQIYRADGDLTFNLIGSVPRDTTGFTDANIDIVSGQRYSYIVRKYRNEAEVAVTLSADQPDGSISLGRVSVENGTVSPNETGVVDIKFLEATVIAEARRRIGEHHHAYYSDADDRRIQLGDTVTVSDWTTTDNFIYTTATVISGDDLSTVPYTILVNGEQTDLLYELDLASGTLTFETQLPESSSVSVVFDNVEEVQGLLQEQKIAYMNAGNITKDEFDPLVLPVLNHAGRIGEQLIPVAGTYLTSDFQYYTADGNNFYGPVGDPSLFMGNTATTCRTFYDIAMAGSGLVAATSHGICISSDFGHSWTRVAATNRAATRIIPITSGYAAAVGPTVMFASSLLTDWHSYDGLSNVSIVRDIVQDSDGNIYATTDVGVFRFDPTLTEPYWVQTSLPDYGSTSFYVAIYESGLSAVVVGGDSGLYYTTDQGATWTLWSAFVEQRIVFAIFRADNALFALTDDRLYRKLDTDSRFSQIAYFSRRCRKVSLFKGRLYVSTEGGVYMSTGDVFNDTSVEFDPTLPQLSEGDNRYVFTTLNVINDRLLLGTENDLYASATHGTASLQYHQSGTFAPSVYLNDELRTLGFFTTFGSVTFDTRLTPDDNVKVANQYLVYQTKNGGWADVAYDAPLTVYYNNSLLNLPTDSRLPSSIDTTGVVVPELTSRNSDFTKAVDLLADVQAALLAAQQDSGSDRISWLLSKIDALEGVCDPTVIIPRFEVTVGLYKGTVNIGSVDAVTGKFSFMTDVVVGGEIVGVEGDLYRFSKYSNLSVDIGGVTLLGDGANTHDQIDDQLEYTLSGIDAKMARVQQANLLKSNLFLERTYPGERNDISPPKQMELFTGCDMGWYDHFNSTVDFALRVRKNPVDVSINYPACVLDVPSRDEVWIGGYGGIIAIKKDSLGLDATITSVFPAADEFARVMLLDGDTVYAVVDDALYLISTADLSIQRDKGIGLPSAITSLAVANNNLLIGASDGVYLKRVTGVWERVVLGQDMYVLFLDDLLMAYDADNHFYSSPSGEAWTDKGDPTDSQTSPYSPNLNINGAVRHQSVFFATSTGLYEDNMTFYSKGIMLKKVNVTGDADEQLSINDIDSDGETLLVGLSDGRYFTYEVGSESGGFFGQDASGVLDTIHKVAVIDSGLWLFGFDKLLVVSQNAVLKLSTGKRLTWQI